MSNEKAKGPKSTSLAGSRTRMAAITIEDMKKSFDILGIQDSYLHAIIAANPSGTVVRVMQNCRKSPDRSGISRKLEEQEVAAITASMQILEAKESEIQLRVSKKLQEERDLKERLQFLTSRVADMQQKLDQSCWNATEPERRIQDDEEYLFSLED